MTENKYKDWVFTWNADESGELPHPEQLRKFLEEHCVDFVFQLEKGEESERFHFQGAFRSSIRLRQSTLLRRFQDAGMEGGVTYLTVNRMLGSWDENRAYCTKPETRAEGAQVICSMSQEHYEGADIKFLEDKSSWFPWQTTLFETIFDSDYSANEGFKDREITWIYDPKGCNGKSKFVKYLCCCTSAAVKVPFGTATQLRNALISIGKKKYYFVDIPRELGTEESLDAVISALEDLKNGFLVSAMFGRYASLIMDPPEVVVFSNQKFPKKVFSQGRWIFLTIDSKTKAFIPTTMPPVTNPWEQFD